MRIHAGQVRDVGRGRPGRARCCLSPSTQRLLTLYAFRREDIVVAIQRAQESKRDAV